jgi:hypothetical protein
MFDRVWRGAECAACKLRDECGAPLDGLAARVRRFFSTSAMKVSRSCHKVAISSFNTSH